MKQFNLEEWLKDKSHKVVTRDGRPVRIACTDSPILHHPIVGFVECDLFTWTDDGKVIYGGKCEDKNDLFFADEEEELTEFEKQLGVYIYYPRLSCDFDEEEKKYIRDAANTLLNLARKEIEIEIIKEQKPAEWCEEDENILNDIIVFTSGYADKRVVKEWVSFLKSLTPRQRQEWSEEDEKIYQSIIDDTVQENQLDGNQITWIKFLKNRVKPQPTSEWSEYDNKMIKNIEDSLNVYSESHPCLNVVVAEELEWLKSIEPNHLKPTEVKNETKNKCPNYSEGYGCSTSPLKQCDTCPDYKLYNHWKPSEEQMEALDKAKNSPANYYNIRLGLQSLYNDLLKL